MKKNVLRVISLILVAGMLFAFASCSQEIRVRFVDKDGNDVDIGGLIDVVNPNGAGNNSTNTTPETPSQSTETPSQSTEIPSQSTETPSQSTEVPSSQSNSQTSGMPTTTEEICNFYKNGVAEIKAGKVGYTKKEWQNVDAVNIGGSTVNSLVTGVLGSFMTVEADAEEQISAKGSDEAKNRIAEWKLTDLSHVASANCVQDGSNYKITIIMKDEDTPKKSGSVLGQVTGALLYWEDIEDTLKNDSTVNKILSDFGDIHVIYKGYKIEAVMTPDGKFVSIDHTADVDILIGYAKITVFTIENKSGHMWNYCKFYNFVY